MSTEKGQKMTLKMSTEGNKIPLNFIMRVVCFRTEDPAEMSFPIVSMSPLIVPLKEIVLMLSFF